VIRFGHVSFRYSPDGPDVLRDVDLVIDEGQFVLVTGPTGSGKSTLLGAVNGHVPHFTGGVLAGRVEVAGLDTEHNPPRDLAHIIGVVGQDPLAGFVTDTVEEELVYGMEQLGVAPAVMRTRVEETLDILGLAAVRRRSLRTLSGGQQQRVAIGSVLTAGARVLVLDEPTSALDPVSAEEVLAALLRLVSDIGLTVMVAEHRLERVVGYADQVIALDGSGGAALSATREAMAVSPLVPPMIDLARRANLPGVPLNIREARAMAQDLARRLLPRDPERYDRMAPERARSVPGVLEPSPSLTGLVTTNLRVTYGNLVAVDDVSVAFPAGRITVLMGRNGSGKSSLLWALTGVTPLAGGSFAVDGTSLGKLSSDKVRRWVRLVPQSAADLLYLPSAGSECDAADRENDAEPGRTSALLEALAPGVDPAAHPRDLSEGQKLALVLAIQLAAKPRIVLLDEPTRGLDYPAKASLARILAGVAAEGGAVGVVTHDVEFAAAVADRVVVMSGGEVIQAGAVSEVLGTSALFASQVTKVLYPQRWLTPYQVERALEDGDPL